MLVKKELEQYADQYCLEKFGSKTGNSYVRDAFIDGFIFKSKNLIKVEGKELVREWCIDKYPSMARDNDYTELDCYDMFNFAEWLFLKLKEVTN